MKAWNKLFASLFIHLINNYIHWRYNRNPPVDDLIRNLLPGCFLESFHNLENGDTGASAKVVDLYLDRKIDIFAQSIVIDAKLVYCSIHRYSPRWMLAQRSASRQLRGPWRCPWCGCSRGSLNASYFTCDLADKGSFDALDSIAIIIRHKDVFVQSVLLQRLFQGQS